MRPRFHPILHVAHLIEARLRAALDPVGLGPRQARMIAAIAEHQPVGQAELARAFDLSPPTLTVMLARLARDGLIRPANGGGRSRKAVELTDAGRALVPRIDAAWAQVDAQLAAHAGAERIEMLSRLALGTLDALGAPVPHRVITAGREDPS